MVEESIAGEILGCAQPKRRREVTMLMPLWRDLRLHESVLAAAEDFREIAHVSRDLRQLIRLRFVVVYDFL